jgi:hypothetical protein
MERGGAGYDLRCGDPAIAHLTLWDNTGKMLFSSLGGAPVYFELGEGKGVPFGLELAAQKMGPAGAYTIILPPELIAPLHPNTAQPATPEALDVQPFPAHVVFPKEGVLIVDLDFVEKPSLKIYPAAPQTR